MGKDLIEVQLSVEIKDGTVIAHLFFWNKSEKKVYLNKQTMYYNGVVRNSYFEIMNSENIKTAYLGIMANCIRKPEEFVELDPGGKIYSSIQLNNIYRLIKGDNYNIQYSAFNPSFSEDQKLMQMESNKVEITY